MVSGTPSAPGTTSVTVTATDGSGTSGSTTFSWTVGDRVAVATPTNQVATVGTPVTPVTPSATDSAAGATVTWSATGLPTGLSIDPGTGTVSGTPTAVCSCTVTLTATDSSSAADSATFTWTVRSSVTVTGPGPLTSPTGTAIAPMTPSATDTQAGSTLTWSATGLPAGLAINSGTGTVSGTPLTACTCSVTLTATDGSGYAGSATYPWTTTNTVTVVGPPSITDQSGTPLVPTVVGAADSSPTAVVTYAALTALPAGISLDPVTGAFTGTPTTAGVYPVTVLATDDAGYGGVTTFTWTVDNLVTVTTPAPPTSVSGTAVVPYTATATDTSPTATITSWSVTGLPPGLTFDPSTAIVTGTPTTGGNYYGVRFTATDSAGFSRSSSIEWVVTNTVSVAPIADRTGVVGHAVTPLVPVAADSQVTPSATFTWTATGLPAGITVDRATGTLSGTPTTAGTSSVVLTAGDNATPKFSGSTTFTWTVTTVLPTVTALSPATGPGAGGTTVRISGTDLAGTTSVAFGSAPASAVTVNSAGTLVTARAPAHLAGTVDVTVTAAGGTSAPSPTDRYTYNLPVVSRLTKVSGSTAGGTTVKIAGSGLQGATSVLFGSTPATRFTVNSAGTVATVISPPGSAGTVNVTVVTTGGTSAVSVADRFTYIAPAVTSVTPASGPAAGGTRVKIIGVQLQGATSVRFGSSPATAVTVNASGTLVTVTAPAHVAGAVDITVVTPGGTTGVVAGDRYTYS